MRVLRGLVALWLAATCMSVLAQTQVLPDFTRLVEEQGSAVVNISTTQAVRRTSALPQIPGMEDDEIQEFFRRFIPRQQPGVPGPGPGPRSESRSLGSGFILSADGYIMTNAHVLEGADEINVRFTDKREFKAKVIGADKRTDVALIKIEASGLPAVRFGDPSKLKVGEWVVAIGAPFVFENTVTAGIVSAKGRSLPQANFVPFIQTDVAINPGNSGGPLFNMRGEVVGINSQIYSRTGGFMGLSFAIPIDVAMDVQSQLRQFGRVSRGRLGVVIQPVTQGLADSFGLPQPQGALVSSVEKGGPADRAGIEPGDVILKLNGQPLKEGATELPVQVASMSPGTTVTLEVWRNHSTRDVSVKLGAMEDKATALNNNESGHDKLGLAVRPLNSQEKREANTSHGLLVEQASGRAAEAGLQPGDVVLAANGAPVSSVDDLRNAVEKSKGHIALLVQRGDTRIFVPIRVG